jgi:hypothetical protein
MDGTPKVKKTKFVFEEQPSDHSQEDVAEKISRAPAEFKRSEAEFLTSEEKASRREAGSGEVSTDAKVFDQPQGVLGGDSEPSLKSISEPPSRKPLKTASALDEKRNEARRKKLPKPAAPARKIESTEVSVEALDQPEKGAEKTAITFVLSTAARERYLEILALPDKDPDKKNLVRRLGVEFRRIYKGYRARIGISYFSLPGDKDTEHAERAAILCIGNEITPGQLIVYWNEHVGDFTSMKYPPLRFLASSTNVESASAELRSRGSNVRSPPKKAGVANNSVVAHVYGDTSKLDYRVRSILEEAAFDVREFSDRQLLTIQNAARTRAKGLPMFVSSKMLPLVEMLVLTLYAPPKEKRG